MPFFDLAAATLPDYRSTVSAPDDFDEFWAATLGEAREHKLDAVFEPYDAGLPLVDVFDVKFAGYGGHPIRGWYIRPRAGKTDSGALVKFLGYNGGRGFPHEHLSVAGVGAACAGDGYARAGRGLGARRYRRSIGSDPAQAGYMTRCGWACRRSPWPSTSATSSARTCCSSSTTSSGSPRRAPRCRRCWAACPARSATSRPLPTRWACCRSGSRRPVDTRSPRCRRSTCPPTTTPTPPRPRRSPTSTPPPSSPATSPRWASTPRSTR